MSSVRFPVEITAFESEWRRSIEGIKNAIDVKLQKLPMIHRLAFQNGFNSWR